MEQSFQPPERIKTSCCVAGGGPAGMMLGFLLARAGVEVVVLEKHADFFRDFRGDTIHPSTLEIMAELDLLDTFLRLPHQEVEQLGGVIGGEPVTIADFSHLSTRCQFIALMPQWDFLNFIAEQARRYPAFYLRMESEVTGLLQEGEQITGVKATTPQGELEVHADLVVGADGRYSTVRAQAGLEVLELGAPIDVLWLRLSRRPDDPEQTLGYVEAGRILIKINRGDYWQCGVVIPKGKFDDIQAKGLAAFRADLVRLAPFLAGRVDELEDWDAIKLLTVRVDRLRQWSRPGLLCLGDAAHAMSPVGGVGINLAIQDAVAAANILAVKLRHQAVTVGDLQAVQRRRAWPARLTQAGQVFIHQRFLRTFLQENNAVSLNWPIRLLLRLPWLRHILARLVGLGVRPEHVKTPVVENQ